ncbi:ferrous iron transport protein B [Sporomusaceae bacterium BoRhaA]|uniref:ferrous iron transport protein B n=1 Tax=Pelorhabdus rhamnosifermentans TaxID=2772457 RepID=UPI001C062B45|nr:ferrous iron transport protein B [Pelorhabdus rhamnosifermentans]MBU2700626.1 ferrous iron transport protein B [Pelorhabdus rhamnosifermentans]
MEAKKLRIALAGNPNSGKTTIFNNLTGSRQHVGNYSGVTVEKKEGTRRFKEYDLLLVDLPGTYSLTTYSPEEVVARDFIVQEKPDVVVDILDAANLERNLYLAVQLLELERPFVLALNMVDVAESQGLMIQDKILAEKLSVPVARMIGNRGEGTERMLESVVQAAQQSARSFSIDYGKTIEEPIQELVNQLSALSQDLKYPIRWMALKLLENDQDIMGRIQNVAGGPAIIAHAKTLRETLQKDFDEDPEMTIATLRYQFVGDLYRQAVSGRPEHAVTLSDKIDKVLTNRVLGIPIFLGMMWIVFTLVFTVGKYPQDWLAQGIKVGSALVGQALPEGDLKSLIVDGIFGGVGSVISFLPLILILFLAISLLEDTGYMARAAFVMDRIMRKVGLHGKSFIPLLLGFGCGVPAIMGTRTLENPRDRLVTILVSPLMSCSARLPIYSVLIAAFFHDDVAGNVLFSIYLLGIVLAILMARIFRSVLFKGVTEPFIMELPPYHLPTIKSVFIHMWERSVLYLKKAGTIILAVSIIMWFLTNFPSNVEYSKDYEAAAEQAEVQFTQRVNTEINEPLNIANIDENNALKDTIDKILAVQEDFKKATEDLDDDDSQLAVLSAKQESDLKTIEEEQPEIFESANHYAELKGDLEDAKDELDKEKGAEKIGQSYAGTIGKFLEPVMAPLGFDWKINIALIAGFSAKEVVVGTLGTIYSVGDVGEKTLPLQTALAADPAFNPLIAYTLMVFCLVYSPCLAAVATIKRETNSWKWAIFASAYTTSLAWVLAFIVYQGGLFLGIGI